MSHPSHPHDHASAAAGGHGHSHGSGGGHGHTHGVVDPSITTSQRGLWALKWSFAGLFATALIQVFIVWISGSVALLADTIHNFGDAATAVPLWIAFSGNEIQSPMAVVILGGLLTSTFLNLVLVPALFARWGQRSRSV
jgi:Co/Zn/Cd efflux system component